MIRRTFRPLAVSVLAVPIVVLAFAGVWLSTGLAQIGDESGPDTLSGTINSLNQDGDGAKQVIGGEWILSLEGDQVTDFSADLEMASADGTGSHTHRIVLSDEQTETAAASEVSVTLVPTEQSVGKSVLVNATGLAESSNVTIKVENMTAATSDSDEDGNLLYALGIIEDMMGTVTVTVEDGEGNIGSATLTIGQATEETGGNQTATAGELSSEGNLTGTESNATAPDSGNATLSGSSNMTTNQTSDSFDSTINNTINIQSYSPTSESESASDSGLTTFEEEAIAAGDEFEDTMELANETSSVDANETTTSTVTDNATSTTLDEPTITAETTDNTITFRSVADIYTDEEIAWRNVDITVTIMNGTVITIEFDPVATDNHFGQEPIYGLVKTETE